MHNTVHTKISYQTVKSRFYPCLTDELGDMRMFEVELTEQSGEETNIQYEDSPKIPKKIVLLSISVELVVFSVRSIILRMTTVDLF